LWHTSAETIADILKRESEKKYMRELMRARRAVK
jgi:hypothetical protein